MYHSGPWRDDERKEYSYESGSYHTRLLVSYVAQRILRSILYALLDLHKIKEETYAAYLNIPKMSSDF
jgi:hypothetical protein